MKSAAPGRRSSAVELGVVSARGFWLRIDTREHFVTYVDFPLFRNATRAELSDVTLLHGFHLRWRRLDIDLELESIEDPSRYPLIDRTHPRYPRVSEPTPRARPAKRAKPR